MEIPRHVKNINDPPVTCIRGWRALAERSGHTVIDLGQAVPNYPPPAGLMNAVADLAKKDKAYFYVTGQGLLEVRAAIERFFEQRYSAKIRKEEILITAGANNGFTETVMALFQPGDELILPEPFYFNHEMIIKACQINLRLIPAGEEQGFLPSIADLDRHVGLNTRALVFVTPHNPTGASAPAEYLYELYKWSKKHNIFIIIDETYQDFSSEPEASSLLLRQPDWKKHIIQVYTFSKSFSLCGMRVGTVTADQRIINEILKIHDCNIICAPVIAQHVAAYAAENELPWLDERIMEMKSRLKRFIEAFEDIRQNFSLVCAGAFFAYIRHDFNMSSWELARSLAQKAGILCLPGNASGNSQEKYLRFAFGNIEPEAFPELIKRLNKYSP